MKRGDRILRRTVLAGLALVAAGAAVAQAPRFPVDAVFIAESYAGAPFARTSRPTLTITADGKASGTSGCNRYFGAATLNGAAITFGAMGMTRMACFGAGADNERAFMPALAAATGWRMDRRRLTLETPGGALVFRRR